MYRSNARRINFGHLGRFRLLRILVRTDIVFFSPPKCHRIVYLKGHLPKAGVHMRKHGPHHSLHSNGRGTCSLGLDVLVDRWRSNVAHTPHFLTLATYRSTRVPMPAHTSIYERFLAPIECRLTLLGQPLPREILTDVLGPCCT